ncbi:hypothetical protein ACIBSS_15435 [Micromonospora aurantiaca]|nr:hypothetical protein [Micromonospora aurantiaca]
MPAGSRDALADTVRSMLGDGGFTDWTARLLGDATCLPSPQV